MIAAFEVTAATAIAAIAATILGLAQLTWIMRRLDRPDDADSGGPGGGTDRGGGPPDGSGGDGEPAWWPEFERDFAAYARQRRSRAA